MLREETLEEAAAVGRALLALLDPASQPGLAGPLAYLIADPESVRARVPAAGRPPAPPCRTQ